MMATINGTNRGETLAGTSGGDTINALDGDDSLFGKAGDDTLKGGEGGDELDGGAGSDVLNGGTGSGVDTADYRSFSNGVNVNLVLGSADDGTGIDTLISIENVDGTSFRDTIIGDQGGNFLTGQAGSDFISANGGTDTILAGDGNDTVLGGSGFDKIDGGRGADTLTGGGEVDHFIYFSAGDSPVGNGARDTIRDFEKGLDKINVSLIDANPEVSGNQAFSFIGSGSFNDEGQIRASAVDGGTLLQFNTSGNTVADFEILLEKPIQVSGLDFFL
jgi:Ca2+-binding RTX toxin-like protein